MSCAANRTPDRATGIGAWTSGRFAQAMRPGRYLGKGRPISPTMPWQALGRLTPTDLRAMFDYVQAQPAVVNAVPAYQAPE